MSSLGGLDRSDLVGFAAREVAVVPLWGLPGLGIVEDDTEAVIAVIKTPAGVIVTDRAVWFGFSHSLVLLCEERGVGTLAPR